MLKFITSSLRSLGITLIIVVSVSAIFHTYIIREQIAAKGDQADISAKLVNLVTSLELRFYDYRLNQQKKHFEEYRSKDIVLVKIDDESLQKIGRWPIPRNIFANMLEKLKHYGAKVVVLDILYPEKSQDSHDDLYAKTMKDFIAKDSEGNVDRTLILSYSIVPDSGEVEKNPDAFLLEVPMEMLDNVISAHSEENQSLRLNLINNFSFPIQKFVETGVDLGYVSSSEDSDGVFRGYQVVANTKTTNLDNVYFASLAYKAFQAYSREKVHITVSGEVGKLKLAEKVVELNGLGEAKIRYIGLSPQFPAIALHKLLHDKKEDVEELKQLKGKIVFVGSIAEGAHDLRPSPLDNKMPGVYAHINMTQMLLDKYFFQDSLQSIFYSLGILTLGLILLLTLQRYDNAILDAFTIFGIMGLAYAADYYYFLPEGYELKLFYCYFSFFGCYSWNTFLNFYDANKEKKQIKGTFARYVAPTIVDEMLKDPSKLQVGGHRMDITCLFSDVRDFTNISETLSATELAHSLNMYMGAMTDIVFDTKGTLDKYIGDAIVALWGAPLPIGNHAQHAVEGAMKMMEALPAINAEFERLGRPLFKVGIGLNSGECSVGNMGSDRIFSYTALGDNMNLGARLESLCKHYGAQILISELTRERIDLTKIKTRPIDKVIVKGKSVPVGVYEVIHAEHWMSKDPDSLNFYLLAHEYFQRQNFKGAYDIFTQLLAANEEDKPSKRFKDLCKKFMEQPELVTEVFDVTKMTEK